MIELLVIGATLTIAAWATGAQAHRRSAASRALERYARSRGLLFVPAPPSPRGASPRVLGEKDELRYAIDLFRLGDEVRTRVSCASARGRAPVVSASQRGAFAWNRPSAVRLADTAFDAAWIVTAGAAEDIEALRAVLRPLSFFDRRRGVWLSSDGTKTALSWRGMESDPLVLDAAREVVLTVASWHRPDQPYR
jgi:hypothetical protein